VADVKAIDASAAAAAPLARKDRRVSSVLEEETGFEAREVVAGDGWMSGVLIDIDMNCCCWADFNMGTDSPMDPLNTKAIKEKTAAGEFRIIFDGLLVNGSSKSFRCEYEISV
jgi:hypothetical protein